MAGNHRDPIEYALRVISFDNCFVCGLSASHEVQIFLLGKAVSLMRTPVVHAIVPVGWPLLRETLEKTILLGVLDTDLERKNAAFANPSILMELIVWADKLLTE